jgi:hypothetical protein
MRMNHRTYALPAVCAVAGLVLLAGCTGMHGQEAAAQAAPVPPLPGDTDTRPAAPQETKKKPEDLPDRLFAPLDNTVNDINRDINRELDSEFPANRNNQTPDPGN